MSKGHIYLIHAKGTKLYKIGLTTRSVEARLKELNGKQSPHELVLRHSIEVDDVHKAEKYFHNLYSNRRYRNEWFKFSRLTAIGVVRAMNQYEREKLQPMLNSAIAAAILGLVIVGAYGGIVDRHRVDCLLAKGDWSCLKFQ